MDTSSEEFRQLCEVRAVLRMPMLDDRRLYLAKVEKHRGKAAAGLLKKAITKEWERQMQERKAA